MKIRRTGHDVDLRALPLDGIDMFLLTRIVGTVSLAELLAVSGCEPIETMRRVEQLVTLGVLKIEGRRAEVPAHVEDGIRELGAHDEDARTLRPPSVSIDSATTKRTTASGSSHRTFARPGR